MNDEQDLNAECLPEDIFSRPEEAVRAYIADALNNGDYWVRANALESISIAGCVELTDIVVSCLRDGHAWVRGKAAEVLGKFRAKDAIDDIIRCLREDDDVMVRLSAVWALGEIGDKRALGILGDVQSGRYSRDGKVSYIQVDALSDVVRNQLAREAENSIMKIRSSGDN